MANNNDYNQIVEEIGLATYGGMSFEPTQEYREKITAVLKKYLIPLSSLKKFIEENEVEIKDFDEYRNSERYGIDIGHNSALKLLKDKFIHE